MLKILQENSIFLLVMILLVMTFFVLFPFGAHVDGDTGYYFAMAAQMASGRFTEIRETLAPGGYPLLLNFARIIFNGDFLKSALLINALSFSIVFIILIKTLKDSEVEKYLQLSHFYIISLLFLILFKQYFSSRILYSAWVEAVFITFSSLGLYFLGRSRREKNTFNVSAFVSLTFFVAAWYCKYVGVIGVLVFFFIYGLSMILKENSFRTAAFKYSSLLGIFIILISPGAILNYLREGNILGAMSSQGQPTSIFFELVIMNHYFERVIGFFNNVFAHLISLVYLSNYPYFIVGIFLFIAALMSFFVFRVDLRSINAPTSMVGRILNIKYFEWYFWGCAYTSAILFKLLSHSFSPQAISRYASILIPVVSLFIVDFTCKCNSKKSRLLLFFLLSFFTTYNLILIYINLPDYTRAVDKVEINNYHNIKGYPQFKKIQQELDKVHSIYFLPQKNKWPLGDKFYALFPCKEFYVARNWGNGALYDKTIYPIPDFKNSYAVVSDYDMDYILDFIKGKGRILRSENILGFSIVLVEPAVRKKNQPFLNNMERNQYIGHGFIAHGCQ